MKVYLLNQEQIDTLQAINTQDATCVVCDHGAGACVGEHDFDSPEFEAHKRALTAMGIALTEIANPPPVLP